MITVEHLSKSFLADDAPVAALRDVSMRVDAGSLHGVVGPSGAGKSTLANCLTLAERPDRGVVRLDGINTGSLDERGLRQARRHVGSVGATSRLNAERTVAGNVAEPLERRAADGEQRRRKVGDLLDLVGLAQYGTTHPGRLGTAQSRRIALARALVTEPVVLLADGVTAELDYDESTAMLTVLDRVRGELGTTVVLTSRDIGPVRRVCEDISVLDGGRLVETGTVLDLLSDPTSRTAQALLPRFEAASTPISCDRVVDVVLIGFAAVGALLPEASSRFDVELATFGGGLTRIGDTPVARFRVAARGQHTDAALAWVAERGGQLTYPASGPQGVAA